MSASKVSFGSWKTYNVSFLPGLTPPSSAIVIRIAPDDKEVSLTYLEGLFDEIEGAFWFFLPMIQNREVTRQDVEVLLKR